MMRESLPRDSEQEFWAGVAEARRFFMDAYLLDPLSASAMYLRKSKSRGTSYVSVVSVMRQMR